MRTKNVALSTFCGLVVASLLFGFLVPNAKAEAVTFTASQTIPVPPASSYSGSGGGDGWGLAFSDEEVYNVFHHSSRMAVACHRQVDASECWQPVVVSSPESGFATPGHTGLWMDPDTYRLFVFVTRVSDATAGVACIDTEAIHAGGTAFCGFTPLSPIGDSPLAGGQSSLSGPALVGTRWYAYNYRDGADPSRAALLCWDTQTKQACPGQPHAVLFTSNSDQSGDYPPPAIAAVGERIVVGLNGDVGAELGCYDAAKGIACFEAWPVDVPGYPSSSGTPFPRLSSDGKVTGVCLPDGSGRCFDLQGGSIESPNNLATAIPRTSGWNGPAVTLGARVYVPDGRANAVRCYDFAAEEPCQNFPRALSSASLVYSVTADPARPTCLWTNADNGSGQIQNFDAYSGGACGDGPIRVLASSFVVPTDECTPANYRSLQVVSPARDTYGSGSVVFQDANANAITGTPEIALDGTGAVDLTALDLGAGVGLPQFLITLNDAGEDPREVTVTLSWTGENDPSCVRPGTEIGDDGGLPDRDNDGLPDFWEEYGLYSEAGLRLVDLPALGADPDRKDIFLRIDYENGAFPAPEEQELVVQAFAAHGIRLHVVRGFVVTAEESDGLQMTYKNKVIPDFQKVYDRMPMGWASVGHYAIAVKDWPVDWLGRALFPGQMFVLNYCENSRVLPICLGSTEKHAGTLMHELGHNLGLGHGGDEHMNFKPNYFSVMNYSYTSGIPGIGITYSDWGAETLYPLDEGRLVEKDGVSVKPGVGFPRNAKARYYCPDSTTALFGARKFAPGRKVQVKVGQPADWDCSGSIDDAYVQANINWPHYFRDEPEEYDDGLREMRPFDDWDYIHRKLGSVERGDIGRGQPSFIFDPASTIA